MTKELDNELAEATDALLSGREMRSLVGENAELAKIVRDLYAAIDPQTPPSAAFQQRLTSRLDSEWERAHPSSSTMTMRVLERPALRVAALAAAVVLVLGALIVLAVPESTPELQGAAVALDDAAAILVLIGVAVAGAVVYWRDRQ